jgi:predicted acylesterase/phospholipase RssA
MSENKKCNICHADQEDVAHALYMCPHAHNLWTAMRPSCCLPSIVESVVQSTQTAFMPGRHILEGVFILHETTHELHRKSMDGVLFKIDIEKAYDNVNWFFLATSLADERV